MSFISSWPPEKDLKDFPVLATWSFPNESEITSQHSSVRSSIHPSVAVVGGKVPVVDLFFFGKFVSIVSGSGDFRLKDWRVCCCDTSHVCKPPGVPRLKSSALALHTSSF